MEFMWNKRYFKQSQHSRITRRVTMTLNSACCITDLYVGTIAGEVTGIVAMPTDSSCYHSITASWAIRKQKVFLNITGVILRVLTFWRSLMFREHFWTMPDGDSECSKSAPKIVFQPANLEETWRGKRARKFLSWTKKHLKGEAH